MSFRRRASLLSASYVPRRVCHEVATNRLHALEHRMHRTINSLSRSLALITRAMHTTPPRSPDSPSSSPACRWNRGRPVATRTSIGRQVHQASDSRTQSLPGQPTTTDTMPSVEGQGQGQQRRVSVQRVRLWDPSQALRFAPLTLVAAQHSLATCADSPTSRQPEVDIPEATRLPENHIAHFGARTGAREDSQASAERDVLTAGHTSASVRFSRDAGIVVDDDFVGTQETEAQEIQGDDADDHDALAYQIPEEKLRAAMLAPPKTRASFWSAKLYEGPNGESINTHYCRSLEVAERVAQYFLKEKVVGFDIEWKPWGSPSSIKQNTSLIQLACEDRIALFHIALFPGTKVEQLMPPSLKAVLESPDICKVGVAVKGDFTRLEKYLGIQSQGVFELSRLHNLVEWYEVDPSKVTKKLAGLAAQVQQHLQLPLYKGEPLEDAPETKTSVRESDWSLPLDLHQIRYAAADAYAGFRLYHMLEWKRTRLRPTPPPIPLCDYDNKPKPKAPRKKIKVAAKPKDATKTELSPIIAAAEEGQEVEEEANNYETAPEELIDSHQLEDPASATLPDMIKDTEDAGGETKSVDQVESQKEQLLEHGSEGTPEHKQIGRINLSWLKSADPGYPTLPKGSQQELEEPPSIEHADSDMVDDVPSTQAQLSEAFNEPEDEFADPELEEALARLNLDDAGRLEGDTKESTLEQEVKPAEVLQSSDVNEADLSSFNPTSLESDDNVPTTPTAKSLTDFSEESTHTPEYNTATKWAQEYLRSTIPSPTTILPSRLRATVPHLRAYHLWYHQKLSIEDMAPLLREPPVSPGTVTNYILQAISLERLDYEEEPLRRAMMQMPAGMRKGQWKGLAEKVGALD